MGAPSTPPAPTSTELLAGRGVGLVRAIALAGRVQSGLERLYQVDRVADVDDFVVESPEAEGEAREQLLVRETEGGVEIGVTFPELGAQRVDLRGGEALDRVCQVIEGVSHFVYLTHRASRERGATQLELELQAEVDKYVVLAETVRGLDADASADLRRALFEDVRFAHPEASEEGARYRLANRLAARYARWLEQRFVAAQDYVGMRRALRAFWREGQTAKLRLAREAA